MADEILNNESQQENVDNSIDYIEAIKEMKQNSVSRDAYDKLKEENQKLIKSLVNGEAYQGQEEKPVYDIDQLRKDLFNDDAMDINKVRTILDLRQALMDQGEVDPFADMGNIEPTEEELATAQKVADGLEYCLENSQGDNKLFMSNLYMITAETSPTPAAKQQANKTKIRR